MSFTYADAINSGLKTELMTVVIQPPPPAPPIIPTVLSGGYKLCSTVDGNGNFNGYEFKVTQNYLTADSISGEFISTEEFMKFAEDLKDSGATLNLVDDFVDNGDVYRYTAGEAQAEGLIRAFMRSKTTFEGRFEISEGVITIYQKRFPFQYKWYPYGAFTTANELINFLNKCWECLQTIDSPTTYSKVQRAWLRKNQRYLEKFYPIKRLK